MKNALKTTLALAVSATFLAGCSMSDGMANNMAGDMKDGMKDGMSDTMAMAKQQQDIVDIAAGDSTFATLVAAVQAADLVDTLKSDGPFTVFAPTNDAFAALPAGTVEMLLKPENRGQLVEILTYHVVPGEVLAQDVVSQSQVASVQGDTIDISVTSNGVQVDNANVIATDILASNGVIHVIDAVILPR